MLFHTTYEFSPQERDQAQIQFIDTRASPPEGPTMQGRRHSVTGRKGFMIAESLDAIAISIWTQGRTDLLSFEIRPVLTDEEVGQVVGLFYLLNLSTIISSTMK